MGIDEMHERLDELDILTKDHDLDCECLLCIEQRDLEYRLDDIFYGR